MLSEQRSFNKKTEIPILVLPKCPSQMCKLNAVAKHSHLQYPMGSKGAIEFEDINSLLAFCFAAPSAEGLL